MFVCPTFSQCFLFSVSLLLLETTINTVLGSKCGGGERNMSGFVDVGLLRLGSFWAGQPYLFLAVKFPVFTGAPALCYWSSSVPSNYRDMHTSRIILGFTAG